jgi:uncharacterized membrane protein
MKVHWKKNIASGLVLIIPIWITGHVIMWAYRIVSNVPVFQQKALLGLFGGNQTITGIFQVGITIILIIVGTFFIGYLMRTTVGGFFGDKIDQIVNLVPGLRIVYNASKMAVETTVSEDGSLQTPVKVTVWPGMRMTAFKTGDTAQDGREILFMPTSPNITTGFVIEVEPGDYEDTGEPVEDALSRILSAGFGVKKQ